MKAQLRLIAVDALGVKADLLDQECQGRGAKGPAVEQLGIEVVPEQIVESRARAGKFSINTVVVIADACCCLKILRDLPLVLEIDGIAPRVIAPEIIKILILKGKRGPAAVIIAKR